MRGLKLTWIALMAILATGRAPAEVRLVESPLDGSLAVDILSTPRGPWTPTGSITGRVLNPSGDLYGDGMPGWDTRETRVLSAWIRPATGVLNKSLGIDDGWVELPALASPGAYGQPVVDTLGGGWSLAWQVQDASHRGVLVTGATTDGRSVEPIVAANGILVGTAPMGDLLHVITLDPATGELWCTTIAFSFVPTQPIPIELAVIGRFRIGGHGPQSPGAGPQQGDDGSTINSLDPRLHDIVRADGSTTFVVTWWQGTGTLAWTRIGLGGPESEERIVSARKSSARLAKLLDLALRQAALE